MPNNPTLPEQTIVVVLAAGKGTRMGRSNLGKVCFEIDGIPAVNRVIGCFKRQRFDRFLLVVGAKAQQVLDAVAREHGGVVCVYQQPQLGSGHAAKVAAEALQTMDYRGNVLVTMGNKFIEEPAIEALVTGFIKQRADVAWLTEASAAQTKKSTGGGDTDDTAAAANPTLYLLRSDAFYRGVGMIGNDNPAGEYHFTDVVDLLSGVRDGAIRDEDGGRQFRVRAVPLENPEWVQSFNSPDELLAIQDYVRRSKLRRKRSGRSVARPRLKASQYGTPRQWLAKLDRRGPALQRWLRKIYGLHDDLHERKCKDLRDVLRCYARQFGQDEKVCIVRAPGRINLMGRHVDHRGGMTNFLAIDRETIAVVGLRDDHDVVAVNTQPRKFKPLRFNVSELIGRFAWSDWLNFVDSEWVRNMLYSAPGDWGNYIKAAVLRLQHRYQDVKIRGLNLALSGNVPIAAGLSSSSTIVVATLQAAIALNGFDLTSRQFIDLCGEGEWFVGSRGGAGDHAAIHLGQRGKIAQVGYLPFRVEKIIDAPRDYQVLIANSHVQATKSRRAKDTFNARIADYNLALALMKQRCPEIADVVQHVRDVDPATIGCSTSDVYRMLLKVPQRMTRADFRSMLAGEHHELIEANFATHARPKTYHPRGVLLFGAAECVRSRMCVELLESGQVTRFGELMRISHDGDRVSRPGTASLAAGGTYRRVEPPCDDEYLHRLITDLGSESPQRVLRAQLYMQPGGYACSTPEIDRMVDVAAAVPGVAGAQIAGAGLGGCIMVLAHKQSVDAVRKALVKHYYRPAKLKPAVLRCIGVDGAGLADF